jgi:hypothetical protein
LRAELGISSDPFDFFVQEEIVYVSCARSAASFGGERSSSCRKIFLIVISSDGPLHNKGRRKVERESFQIRSSKLDQVLSFLVEAAFIEKRGNECFSTRISTHLEKTSPFLPTHHRNVRFQALEMLSEERTHDLRYSAYFSDWLV